MNNMQWVTFGVLVFNLCLVVWEGLLLRRAYKTMHHALMLDGLLAHIVTETYSNQNMPVWRAWAATMGEIDVTISLKRKSMEGNTDAV